MKEFLPFEKLTLNIIVVLKSHHAGIGATHSAEARFFHQSKHIIEKCTNKGNNASTNVSKIDDAKFDNNTIFHLVKNNNQLDEYVIINRFSDEL